MILCRGKIYDSKETKRILNNLPDDIISTLQSSTIDPNVLVNACDCLAKRIEDGVYDQLLEELVNEKLVTKEQIETVINLLKRESLYYKLETELGIDWERVCTLEPPFIKVSKKTHYAPLGVLFHIAAGNMEGLPFYSIIEGLLTGNINIVKLPAVDKALSIQFLLELIQIEPKLRDYIYVFDTPSTDIESLKKMATLADGVIVWGGDAVVEAVRKFAPPNKQIIAWGHKISFAYITEEGMRKQDEELVDLARHIFETKQLLCSSCQGIYLDTQNMDDICAFGEKFLKILEMIGNEYEKPEIGIQAQITLQLYNQELEAISEGRKNPKSVLPVIEKNVLRASACSVICSNHSSLETSFLYGNCWVKPLAQKEIIRTLYPYRGYLQTVGLICSEKERETITALLCKAGVNRVYHSSEMSSMICGEAHDGEYPLQRYSRIVTW